MTPTRRGLTVLLAALSLAFASVLFDDFIVEAVLLVVVILGAYDVLWVGTAARRPTDRYALVRTEAAQAGRGEALLPGEQSVERVRLVKEGGTVDLRPEIQFLSVEPSTVSRRSGDSLLEFRFRSPYAGEYRVRSVGVRFTGPLGLVSSGGSVPFEAAYFVRPRVVSVAAASINLFGKGGFGGTPVDYPGNGTEFYEMREYQRGDDYRSVNWKASARGGQLIVNQKVREGGTTYLLVLDATAPGFFDSDRLASTFLSMANSLTAAGLKFAVLSHEGERVTHVTESDDPGKSLATAIRAALRFADLDSVAPAELVPTRLVAAVAEGRDGSAVQGIPQIRAAEVRSEVDGGGSWRRILDFVREGGTQNIVYVSGLFGSVEPLVELVWKARRLRDVDIVVADPCMPWVCAEDEAARYSAYQAHQKAVRALRASGIPWYGGDPADISRRVLSHEA